MTGDELTTIDDLLMGEGALATTPPEVAQARSQDIAILIIDDQQTQRTLLEKATKAGVKSSHEITSVALNDVETHKHFVEKYEAAIEQPTKDPKRPKALIVSIDHQDRRDYRILENLESNYPGKLLIVTDVDYTRNNLRQSFDPNEGEGHGLIELAEARDRGVTKAENVIVVTGNIGHCDAALELIGEKSLRNFVEKPFSIGEVSGFIGDAAKEMSGIEGKSRTV